MPTTPATLRERPPKAKRDAVSLRKSAPVVSAEATQSPASASAPSPSASEPTRRARFAVDDGGAVKATVTLFNTANPAAVLKSVEDVDYSALEKAETHALLLARMRGHVPVAAPAAKQGPSPAVPAQAFSIFAIPVMVDSAALTVAELKSELRARGLRVDGPKKQLVARLDKYIHANERERIAAK